MSGLWHEASGSGPPLVLVHAGICDARMWDEVAGLLAPEHRVLRYDMRGYGRSGPAVGTYSPRADLLSVLDAEGIERAAVCGVSFGGAVAIETAVVSPERVSALAVVCSAVDWSAVPPELAERIEEADAAGEAGDIDRAVELELRIWVDGDGRREPVDTGLRERVREMNRRAWELAAQSNGEADWSDEPPAEQRLDEIAVPTLVVAGEWDVAFMRASCRDIARRVRGAQFATMSRAAHLPPLERPAEFASILHEFLDGD